MIRMFLALLLALLPLPALAAAKAHAVARLA
ncbi:MAG: hypothetical protein JWP16_1089, partial [Alphaproteobacteria bacterium]|nr:hypothetical protein [Alphaproteobacteria bacterium]